MCLVSTRTGCLCTKLQKLNLVVKWGLRGSSYRVFLWPVNTMSWIDRPWHEQIWTSSILHWWLTYWVNNTLEKEHCPPKKYDSTSCFNRCPKNQNMSMLKWQLSVAALALIMTLVRVGQQTWKHRRPRVSCGFCLPQNHFLTWTSSCCLNHDEEGPPTLVK